MSTTATATELVKTLAPQDHRLLDTREFRGFIDAKGFDLKAVSSLGRQGYFAPLFRSLVLRDGYNDSAGLNEIAESIASIQRPSSAPYTGSHEQNREIDRALANSGIGSDIARFGEGAATYFRTNVGIPDRVGRVPIAIIGYGAAGIIAAATLRNIGFQRITVYEKSRPLGIWSQENVYGLSRNNPSTLRFFGGILNAAPGDGYEVRDFLDRYIYDRPTEEQVATVKPGNLRHTITTAKSAKATYPIVINTVGLGKPKPVSDPSRMVTESGVKHAGLRWQIRLDPEKASGQRIVLIGLGNSTAEMLRQIHELADQGIDIDYRIVTHYPEEAVRNPTLHVAADGKIYRVFRDTSRPNLVDFQGDLPNSRRDYFRALHGGKIVSGVRRWEVGSAGVMTVFGKGGAPIGKIPFNRIMTLIGYGQSEETMTALGCFYDRQNRCAVFDYDGESVRQAGEKDPRRRLHKGYFGFGSVLESPTNPNALVIPGMLHRIGDLAFGVVMRAAEHAYGSR